MKYELHVPVESFGFVSIHGDSDDMNVIAHNYRQVSECFKPEKVGDGLEKKVFDGFLDKIMMGGSIHVSDYEQMDGVQQVLIQAVKRSQARIERLVRKQDLINDQGVENIMSQSE